MNGIVAEEYYMANEEDYNPAFCKRIHKEIDRRLDKTEQDCRDMNMQLSDSLKRVHERIDQFNNKLNYIILFLGANFIGAVVTILTTTNIG